MGEAWEAWGAASRCNLSAMGARLDDVDEPYGSIQSMCCRRQAWRTPKLRGVIREYC